MQKSNFHTHTIYSDGHDTLEEMIETALEKGFHSLGISDHSPMCFEADWDMTAEGMVQSYDQIRRLSEVYRGRIALYSGLELDAETDKGVLGTLDFDYIISSVHFLKKGSEFYAVDLSPEEQGRLLRELCGGDWNEFAKRYYEALLNHVSRSKTDIVGHFDLLTKYSLVPQDDGYLRIAEEALAETAKYCKTFELNTGAIARGLRTEPYPDKYLLRRIKELGGRVLITSDCHYRQKLDCWFDRAADMLTETGFVRTEKAVLNEKVSGIEIWT